MFTSRVKLPAKVSFIGSICKFFCALKSRDIKTQKSTDANKTGSACFFILTLAIIFVNTGYGT